MQAVLGPPNRLLQALPAAEFHALSPLLETVEQTKGAALTEAGAPPQYVYPPHSGVVSMMVAFRKARRWRSQWSAATAWSAPPRPSMPDRR
jgi:hypothetical protein